MIFLWFSTLGEKLPFILHNGSQNCILSVRMNVSGKSKSSERFLKFLTFPDFDRKLFGLLAKFFDRVIKTAFYMSRANFWEKNYLKVFSILYHLWTSSIFLVFGQKFQDFVKNVVWVSRKMSPKIFVCRKDFFKPFWFWTGIFLFSGLVFFRRNYRKCILNSRRKIFMVFPGTF